ncbi:pantoate--beta-alanine ligase, partial [Acinetobacter baumannii]
VRDLAFDTEIVVLPTVREASGLALSSRNAYLNEEERRAAAVLYRALTRAEQAYINGERSARKLIEIVGAEVATEPRV